MNSLDLYLSLKSNILTGDFILWQTDTPLGYAIQAVCASKLTHVSIAVRIPYSPGKIFLMEALGTGLDLNRCSDRLTYQAYQNSHAWVFPLDMEFDSCRPVMAGFLFDHLHIPYDKGILIEQLFCRTPLPDELKETICSEAGQFSLLVSLSNASPDAVSRVNAASARIGQGMIWRPSDWPVLQECRICGKEYQIL